MTGQNKPVFRFAPSPNGFLHLGHALSAMLNFDAAMACGGRFLLRIEDIDTGRSREAYVQAIAEDLQWLGLVWEMPVRHQSRHFSEYAQRLEALRIRGFVYPCRCTRSDIQRAVAEMEKAQGAPWPRDPDGAFIYPGTCRGKLAQGDHISWRLDMHSALTHIGAPLFWCEEIGASPQQVLARAAPWGDVILARKDIPVSYHLAVVHDDAAQGVSHIIRGEDLREATAIHCVLQTLLDLPAPVYRHHDLVRDQNGQKLSKSLKSTALRELRAQGITPAQVREKLGLRQV